MPTGLDSLPFDVFHTIACSLNVREYIYLSRVCKRINALLRNESTARICLQVGNFGNGEDGLNQADYNSEVSQAQEDDDKLTLIGAISVFEEQLDGPSLVERLFAQLSLTPLQLQRMEPTLRMKMEFCATTPMARFGYWISTVARGRRTV
jgi:hypothetical protein